MQVKTKYKQTEVGSIPEEWQISTLGEGIKLLSGQHVIASACNSTGFGIPYITGPADFQGETITCTKYTKLPTTLCEAGDILLTVKGSGTGSLIVSDKSYCISRQLMAVRTFSFDRDFLYYKLLSDCQFFQSSATGLIPGIARSDVLQRKLAIPPLLEQRAIATALSDVDALIKSLDRLIAKKRDIKQATMQQLLTGKTRLSGFHDAWTSGPFSDLLKVRHGKSQHAVSTLNGTYPILATGGEIGRTDVALFYKPSVLIGRKGTIDKPQYVTTPFWTIDTLFYTEIDLKKAHPKFVYYVFQTIPWKNYNEASGVPSLNASTIENIELLCPALPEQRAIEMVLSDLDREIDLLAERRDKTLMLKQGMMQELLTGRTRLV